MTAVMRRPARGTPRLPPGETLLWQGRPHAWTLARHAFHLRAAIGYFVILLLLNMAGAVMQGDGAWGEIRDSVPLLIAGGLVAGFILLFAWLSARATTFTITTERLVMRFGVALPVTLMLPFARITSLAVALRDDHTGDIALTLAAGDHLSFLKLWPHARPWHWRTPQPMLRAVPRAAVVAGILSRALAEAETARRRQADPVSPAAAFAIAAE